jgi:hypothetical protein
MHAPWNARGAAPPYNAGMTKRLRISAVALATVLVLAPAMTFAAANVQRLTANGLSLTDPQIVTKLRGLFASRGRKPVAGPAAIATVLTTPPLRVQAIHVTAGALSLARLGGVSRPLTNGAPASTPTPAPASTAPAGTAPTIASIETGYFKATASEGLDVQGSNLGGNPSAKLTTTNCGNSQPALSSTDPTDWIYGLGYAVPANEPANLTLSTSAYTLNAGAFILYPSLNSQATVAVPIGDVAPFFGGDALNESPSTYATTVASHSSTNPADPTASGTDTLGYGVSLTNGWYATAQISNIHSYMDSPSEPQVSDAFRSASISQQPAGGRLETKVAWSFEGGESISYTITWTFKVGAEGARMVTSQPKKTPCTDEQ